MRLIQAMFPTDARESVVDALQAEGVTFALADETSGDGADLLFVPAETEDVESIVDVLRETGVEDDGYIVVSEATAMVSEHSVDIPDDRSGPGHRISREELHTAMAEELRDPVEYVVFTVLSAVFATAGLLLDSATVITGSMVVAPVLGLAVVSSVGSVVGDDGLVREGLKRQVVGLGVAVTSAAIFAFLSRLLFAPFLNLAALGQVSEFSSPGALTLAIALVAGIAAALSLTTGTSTSLVGVAVAAALVPPSAVVGLGIAYGEVGITVGAGVVLLVNLLSINLLCLVTLRVAGYRPEGASEKRRVRHLLTRRALLLALAVLVVSSVVGLATLNQRRTAEFEHDVTQIAERTANPLSVTVQYQTEFLFREPHTVVVHVGTSPPDYADRLRERIRQRTSETVRVVVYEATGVAASDRSVSHSNRVLGRIQKIRVLSRPLRRVRRYSTAWPSVPLARPLLGVSCITGLDSCCTMSWHRHSFAEIHESAPEIVNVI